MGTTIDSCLASRSAAMAACVAQAPRRRRRNTSQPARARPIVQAEKPAWSSARRPTPLQEQPPLSLAVAVPAEPAAAVAPAALGLPACPAPPLPAARLPAVPLPAAL